MGGQLKPLQAKPSPGCWQCRNRRVKCDFEKPQCSNCLKYNVKCGGYRLELVWNRVKSKCARRPVLSVEERLNMASRMDIDYIDVDNAIGHLAEVSTTQLPDGESVFKGPFGLVSFRTLDTTQKCQCVKYPNLAPPPPHGPFTYPRDIFYSILTSERCFCVHPESCGNLSGNPTEAVAGARSSCQMPPAPDYYDAIQVRKKYGESMFSLGGLVPLAPELLQYYKDRVVQSITPPGVCHNSWRDIYMPRAMMACKTFADTGIISAAGTSLLCSILAVSTFHMINRNRDSFPEQFASIGYQARGLSCQHLQIALREYSNDDELDLLAAVMNLCTVEVTLGTFPNCENHIRAVQLILDHANPLNKQMGDLAQVARFTLLMFETGRANSAARPFNKSIDTGEDSSHSEDNYGYQHCVAPETLVAIQRSWRYSTYLLYYHANQIKVPRCLQRKIESLGRDLEEWKPKPVPMQCTTKAASKIASSRLEAFHLAARIYYLVYITELIPRSALVQSLSRDVLRLLETADEEIRNLFVLDSPVIWPAFFASIVASTKGLQTDWNNWWARHEGNGFQYIGFARQVVNMTWAQGDWDWKYALQKLGMDFVILA